MKSRGCFDKGSGGNGHVPLDDDNYVSGFPRKSIAQHLVCKRDPLREEEDQRLSAWRNAPQEGAENMGPSRRNVGLPFLRFSAGGSSWKAPRNETHVRPRMGADLSGRREPVQGPQIQRKSPAERVQEKEDDLVAKARFETACQLLHKQMLDKDHRLTVSEKTFLNRLLDDSIDDEDEFEVSDRLSQIELSIKSLKDDPLFSSPPSSPEKLTRSKRARIAEQIERTLSKSSAESDDSGIEVLSSFSVFNIKQTLDDVNRSRSMEDDLFGPKEDFLSKATSRLRSNSLSRNSYIRGNSSQLLNDYAYEDSPYPILGILPRDRILSLPLMEALRAFLPNQDHNYWLKFDSRRDQVSMPSLLSKIRASRYTMICVKAMDGSVFGSFTTSAWRLQKGWYGDGTDGSFLFRSLNGKIEVYPITGNDNFVQYCTAHIIAVGGGDWQEGDSPYANKESHGIGFLIDGDLAGGESNSCATFANPRLFDGGEVYGNEFTIESMEVWTLTPCADVKQAEAEELRRLFIMK